MRSIVTFFPPIALVCLCSAAFATVQGGDEIRYGDQKYSTYQVPMAARWHWGEDQPPPGKTRAPEFDDRSTGNRKGYLPVWEIRNKKLLLLSITARQNGKKVKDGAILPNEDFPIEATWFTGKLHVPLGDYDVQTDTFESVLVFEIKKGIVKSIQFVPSMKTNKTWNGE